MVFIRYCVITAVWVCCILSTKAQTVYYPEQASDLLKATANDIAMLMQKAVKGKSFSVQPYNASNIPAQGLVLVYDPSINGNQSCIVKSDGSSYVRFSAAEDNGLNYGIYKYIQQLGFRFYLPGDIWEVIPSLVSSFKKTDTVYSGSYKYKTWFMSGGHNRWVMDNNNDYPWDVYYGDNGHQWALYQRRNNMSGAYRFTGHRGDIMTAGYLETLKKNPCYIAPYNGLRNASVLSVPDINNVTAMQQWQTAIEQKYTSYKNTIFTSKFLYPNLVNNFSYYSENIGIEVPDGAQWANSIDNTGCSNKALLSASDQSISLANFTASAINKVYPNKGFNLYAYASHADVPSSSIAINKNIDIQVVPTAFQFETSAAGLMNRWLKRSRQISEYHYINLPQWSGETPSFFANELKATLKRIKDYKEQGIVVETSPAKFASIPYLFAANTQLDDNISLDETLQNLCNELFGKAANTVFTLLQYWGDDKTVLVNYGIMDNKYKLPFYFNLLQKAVNEAKDEDPLIKQRLAELKAYLHYMVLYYDFTFDQRTYELKQDKAATLCIYLAKINKLKLVNSYFLITDIVNRCEAVNGFFEKYNTTNGTAYKNGNLSLITEQEIENDFNSDVKKQSAIVQQYNFEDAVNIKAAFADGNMQPLDKIKLYMNYTYATDYAARTVFYIDAEKAGNFSIAYTPQFEQADKGYINFTVESTSEDLTVIKDFSINQTNGKDVLIVDMPAAGTYKLTITSKYKSAISLEINTNGNYFYKNGLFLGNATENYRSDLQSLPGYFHVPPGVNKIFFSINNSNPGGKGFATPEEISKAFVFKDNKGNTAEPKLVSPQDSALFYLDIPKGADGSFWQSYKMEQYRLIFANISNITWHAKRKVCNDASFTVSLVHLSQGCAVQLKTTSFITNPVWKIVDGNKTAYYKQQQAVTLSENISPDAVVTLYGDAICAVSKKLKEDAAYLQQLQQCAAGAPVQDVNLKALIYPNPGRGTYNCMINGQPVIPREIKIFNSNGSTAARFSNTGQFNIGHLSSGIYIYQLIIDGVAYRGKLVKQ